MCKYKRGLLLQLIQRIHLKENVVSRYTTYGQRKSVIIDKTNQPKNNYQRNIAGEFLARIEDLLLVAHLYIFVQFFFSSLQGEP